MLLRKSDDRGGGDFRDATFETDPEAPRHPLSRSGSRLHSSMLLARKYPILMVTIHSFTAGQCIWCRQTSEGVQVQFQDGLKGFLCKRDFWSALKARTEETPPAPTATEPTPPTTPPRRPA